MQIGVLGPLRIETDDGALALPGRRQRALLCRLALTPNELVPAAVLVEDLWDGMPTPGAAATLQSHVSAVRKVLGAERIVSQAGGYRLAVEPADVDARRAAALAGEARRLSREGEWSAAGELADDAAALFRGEPYGDAGGALWVRGEVTRLTELRLELVELRLDAALVAGDHAAAAAEAEAVLADEPLRERFWAQLMVALDRSGRRAESLRAFQRLRRTLGDDLGLEPSPALVALEAAIAVDDPAVATGLPWAPSAVVVAPVPPVPATPLGAAPRTTAQTEPTPVPPILRDAAVAATVGRVDQRAALDGALAELAAGRGGTFVVAGEGGIGKTTLVAQATAAAHGVGVRYGRCLAGGELYYQPFVDALGPTVERRAAEPSGDASVDRHLLFQGVERRLLGLAAERPLALVIDDLHWADDGTVALVRHLADRVADEPLLLVVAMRTVDLDPDGAAAVLLADLHRTRQVTRIDLDGLDVGEVAELAERYGAGADVADRLTALTAGNPYFVAELLRHGWLGGDGAEPLPATVADMVRRRAGDAGPDVVRVLAGAAVIGASFDATLVAEVTEQPAGEVLDALDHALDRGLIVEQEQSGGRVGLAFTHALTGAALAGTLSATRRRALHRRCALVLGGRRRTPPATVAFHWVGGYEPGDEVIASDAACRAGEDALAQFVPSEALAWFDRAADIADDGEVSAAAHARRLVGRARALFDLNDAGAGAAVREAVGAAAASDDVELLAAAALTGSRGFASSLSPIRVRRVALLEQAVEAGPLPATRSRLLADLATELMMFDAERASALAREAIELADASGDAADQLHALRRAAAVGSPLVVDWIWPMLDRANALAARLGDRHAAWELAVCTRLLATLRGDRRRLDVAAAAVSAPGSLADLPRVRHAVVLDEARVALLDGRPHDALASLDELTRIGAEHGMQDARTFHHIYAGAAQRQLGTAGDWAPLGPYESFDAATTVVLADLGDIAAAEARLEVALGTRSLAAIPMSNHWLTEVGCWGYAAARLHRGELAAEAQALLAPHAARTDELVGPVSHVVGLCAGLTAPADAAPWLALAATQAADQRLAFAQALVAVDRADMARTANDVVLAQRSAGDAAALAAERGYAGIARRAGEHLGGRPISTGPMDDKGAPR